MASRNEGSTRVGEGGMTEPARPVTPVSEETVVAPAREETVVAPTSEEHRSVEVQAGSRRDRVGWGAVWAGTLTTLATFLLLELAFFALGWLTPGADNAPGPSDSQAWMTLLAGLLAFAFGGLTAAASSRLRGMSDGILHGIMVWALTVTSILLLTLLGGGALFGAFSNVLGQLNVLQNALGSGNVQPQQLAGAVDAARGAAQAAVLALGVSVAAAAVGGAAGAKMWPGEKAKEQHEKTIDLT
jgi:hypothetical protein